MFCYLRPSRHQIRLYRKLILRRTHLFGPVKSDVMTTPPNQIRIAIAIDIRTQNWQPAVSCQFELGMPNPTPVARIGRTLSPTIGRHNIHSVIAIEIPRSNPMPHRFVRQIVSDKELVVRCSRFRA